MVSMVSVEGSVELLSVAVVVEARGSIKGQSQGVRCTHNTHFHMHTRTHTQHTQHTTYTSGSSECSKRASG